MKKRHLIEHGLFIFVCILHHLIIYSLIRYRNSSTEQGFTCAHLIVVQCLLYWWIVTIYNLHVDHLLYNTVSLSMNIHNLKKYVPRNLKILVTSRDCKSTYFSFPTESSSSCIYTSHQLSFFSSSKFSREFYLRDIRSQFNCLSQDWVCHLLTL